MSSMRSAPLPQTAGCIEIATCASGLVYCGRFVARRSISRVTQLLITEVMNIRSSISSVVDLHALVMAKR